MGHVGRVPKAGRVVLVLLSWLSGCAPSMTSTGLVICVIWAIMLRVSHAGHR